MRTDAPANILNNYLNAAKKPRLYVRIPELDLFFGTRAATIGGSAYGNRLKTGGVITWDAPYFGGMGSTSSVTIENLELDRNITLAESAEIEAASQGGIIGAGRVVRQGTSGETYEDIRGASTGSFYTSSMIVGRWFFMYGGSDSWAVSRGPMQFMVPSGLSTCDDAAIELTGLSNNALTGFRIVGVRGTWSAWNQSGLYDDFDGHQAGLTAYDGEILTEDWHSSQFSTTAANKIRLNERGRAYIEENAGGMVKFMLLSKRDYDGVSAPDDDEYLKFETASATLKLYYNLKRLKNKTAQIYVVYGDVPTSLDDIFCIWTGVVHDYEISDETLRLELRQAKNKHDRYLPINQINKQDYPLCPDINVGKPYPIVIGRFEATTLHRAGQGNWTAYGPVSGLMINYSYPDCYKTYVVKNEPEKKTVLLSEQPVISHGQPFFIWNSGIQAFDLYHVKTTLIAPIGISEKDIEPRTETTGFPHNLSENQFKGLSTILPFKHVVNGVGDQIENPEQAYDEDSDTYCTINEDNCSLDFYFQTPEGISGTGAVAFLVYAKFVGGADPTDFHFLLVKDKRISIDDPHDWEVISDQATWTGDGLFLYGFYLIDDDFNRKQIPLEQYRMTLYRDTDDTGEVQVYDVCAVMAYNAEEATELFTYGSGMPYGTWIDEAGRSNDYDQADVIETPPFVIEALSRAYMGLTSTEIDTSAFDASAALLEDWKFAYEILELTKGMSHFGDLGEQCKSLVGFDFQNRLTVLTFNEDRAFPYAAASSPWAPGELDIFDESARPNAGGVFTRHPIEPDTFTVRPMDEVINDYKLNYRYNYGSGKYEGVLYIDHGGGVLANVDTNIRENYLDGGMTLGGTGGLKDLTSRCYTRLGTTNTKVIDCPAIRDEETATKLLQFFIMMYSKERNIAEFRTFDNAILHEVWDFINIRHRRLLSLMDQARMESQKWWIVRKQFDSDAQRVGFKAIEL